mmetsp:Transcript_5771/g.10325  ORF Transcript_5771/g.10325 Transcript_5771/m.10325 type:complete len:273 (+) Transcript_5771:52-870(+)
MPVPLHVTAGRMPSSFEQVDAMKAHVDGLRHSIEDMNAAWGQSREVMERSYGRAHMLKQQLDSTWQAGRAALDAACRRLRDSVDKAGEDRMLCEEAQSSTVEGLPALFLKRFKDPMRFGKFQGGVIHGCQPSRFGSAPPSDECTCPTGHEELGCQDSSDASSFSLKCSNALNTEIPALGVMDFFKSGGACHISGEDAVVKQVVDDDMLKHLQTSTMHLDPAFLSVLTMAVSEQRFQRKSSLPWRGPNRGKAAREFLFVSHNYASSHTLRVRS